MDGRNDGDDPGETPSPRTTIVGGRPPEDSRGLPRVPTGIQRLLRFAAVDGDFRRRLIERRGDLGEAAGVPLTPSEHAILAAVPEAQLLGMIEGLPPPSTARREFLRQGAASAVILLGGAAFVGSMTTGCTPEGAEPLPGAPPPEELEEKPPLRPELREMETEGGMAPHVPEEEKPDEIPEPPGPEPAPPRPEAASRGHRPDMPPPRPDDLRPTRGIRPDIPPPRPDEEMRTGGIRPDMPPWRPTDDPFDDEER